MNKTIKAAEVFYVDDDNETCHVLIAVDPTDDDDSVTDLLYDYGYLLPIVDDIKDVTVNQSFNRGDVIEVLPEDDDYNNYVMSQDF